MLIPNWHDCLQSELIRSRLPRSYRERLTDELLDHLEDLQEEIMSTDARSKRAAPRRLGSPEAIAQLAREQYTRQPFYRRYPLALALLTPLPLLVVSFAGLVCLLAVVGWSMGIANPELQPWTVDSFAPGTVTLLHIGYSLAVMASFAVSAWIICRLARRFRLVGVYSLLACTIVALVAVMFRSEIVLPVAPGKGMIFLSLGFPAVAGQLSYLPSHVVRLATGHFLLIQTVQAALPILIGLYFIHRARTERTMAA